MAGSRLHVTAEDGSFTFDLIDNMGDAYEACEELFELVNRYEFFLQEIATKTRQRGTAAYLARQALTKEPKP